MPLRDYGCKYCGNVFELLVYTGDPDNYKFRECPKCQSQAEVLPALIGGYQGNMGGGSTRPKNSTSMPHKKVFTGPAPGGTTDAYDEPTTEEIERNKKEKTNDHKVTSDR